MRRSVVYQDLCWSGSYYHTCDNISKTISEQILVYLIWSNRRRSGGSQDFDKGHNMGSRLRLCPRGWGCASRVQYLTSVSAHFFRAVLRVGYHLGDIRIHLNVASAVRLKWRTTVERGVWKWNRIRPQRGEKPPHSIHSPCEPHESSSFDEIR